jgi:hypothetical protein
MPTTQTQLPPPPVRDTTLSKSEQLYLAMLQYQMPIRKVDTTAGPYAEAAPAPGLSNDTGQTNQNQQISYVKTSADVNVFTLNGVAGGPYTLTNQHDSITIKSDASNWYVIARIP